MSEEKQKAYYAALAISEEKERQRAAELNSFEKIYKSIYNDNMVSMLRVVNISLHSDGSRPPDWVSMPPLEKHGPRAKPYIGQSLRKVVERLKPEDEDYDDDY